MSESPSFGRRLRELRRAKGLSQREVAGAVQVDVTYLSKLENDRMAPPSAATIAALASVLSSTGEEQEVGDELSVLAGKIPTDIAERLSRDLDAVKLFRSMAGEFDSKADFIRRRASLETPPED